MKKLLNILYITQPAAYLYKDGQNVVVSVDQKEVFRIPILNIEGIVTFGYAGCSPGLMKLCIDSKVSLTFLSPHGKFIARIQGPLSGNILLRKKQHFLSENEESSLRISQLIISSKIHNYRAILNRYIRDYGDNESIQTASTTLLKLQRQSLKALDKESLRGYEGMAASCYFEVFPCLITQQKSGFPFNGRNRRPPKDAVNAMLSFAYTLIANEIISSLEAVGLDSQMGIFHTLRPGRHSLALDIMEEFRAYLGDRLVLSLINRRQIQPKDFKVHDVSGILMSDNAKKKIISTWQERKKEEILHPYLQERIPIGLLPYVQCVLLARVIREDIDTYPPFLIK